MKLTGKAKQDFDKWFFHKSEIPQLYGEFGLDLIVNFYALSESMKYGVYVDFFDGVGLKINTYSWNNKKFGFSILKRDRYLTELKVSKSRKKLRIKSIESANKLYNDANNN